MAKNLAGLFMMTAFVALIFGEMVPAVAAIAKIVFLTFLGLSLVAFLAVCLRRNPATS
jgi:hypothetical protein